MTEAKTGAGLRGVTAGSTGISTVGKEGVGLTYRGYSIAELAARSTFEEVAYLLLEGELPRSEALLEFRVELSAGRGLPAGLRAVLECLPADSHPMDVLRTGCSALGSFEPERSFAEQKRVARRLIAALPGMLLYWYHFTTSGRRVDTSSGVAGTSRGGAATSGGRAIDTSGDRQKGGAPSGEQGVAEHFLTLLHGRAPTAEEARALDVSLILYAEHEFNASTFAARVCAATLSDFYSAITAGIGTLRGPLHGGANEAAMELIDRFPTPEAAVEGVREMLARKVKVMGFGHAVYRSEDPRSPVIKRIAKTLAVTPEQQRRYAVAEAIEALLRSEKNLFPNVDFYSALVYRSLGISTPLFTPLFVCARSAGWSAHILEQRADNRLIRPAAEYVGPASRPYLEVSERT
jgi:2-methylcitrate synthase